MVALLFFKWESSPTILRGAVDLVDLLYSIMLLTLSTLTLLFAIPSIYLSIYV